MEAAAFIFRHNNDKGDSASTTWSELNDQIRGGLTSYRPKEYLKRRRPISCLDMSTAPFAFCSCHSRNVPRISRELIFLKRLQTMLFTPFSLYFTLLMRIELRKTSDSILSVSMGNMVSLRYLWLVLCNSDHGYVALRYHLLDGNCSCMTVNMLL